MIIIDIIIALITLLILYPIGAWMNDTLLNGLLVFMELDIEGLD